MYNLLMKKSIVIKNPSPLLDTDIGTRARYIRTRSQQLYANFHELTLFKCASPDKSIVVSGILKTSQMYSISMHIISSFLTKSVICSVNDVLELYFQCLDYATALSRCGFLFVHETFHFSRLFRWRFTVYISLFYSDFMLRCMGFEQITISGHFGIDLSYLTRIQSELLA